MNEKIVNGFCGHGLLPEDVTPKVVEYLSLLQRGQHGDDTHLRLVAASRSGGASRWWYRSLLMRTDRGRARRVARTDVHGVCLRRGETPDARDIKHLRMPPSSCADSAFTTSIGETTRAYKNVLSFGTLIFPDAP